MTPHELQELADLIADRLRDEPSRPRLVDRYEMARLAIISVATLDRRTKAGVIPSIKDGSRRLYDPSDVIASMKSK